MTIQPRILTRAYNVFSPRFLFPQYNIVKSDFKGHQMKALKKIETLSPQLNMILELRDIRAPISTKNIIFDKLFKDWRHKDIGRLIIYTKGDLLSNDHKSMLIDKLTHWHGELKEKFIVIDARNRDDVRNLYKILEYQSDSKMNEIGMPLPMGFRTLITGMPNLGKSTLINSLRGIGQSGRLYGKLSNKRKTKVAKTGNEAGVTRSTSEYIRISAGNNSNTNDPNKILTQPIYLIDTPGIGLPGRISSELRMLSQSLCGSLKSNTIDPVIVSDYLLYLMNLQTCNSKTKGWYPGYWDNPTNNVYEVLKRLRQNKKQDENSVALQWNNYWSKLGNNLMFDLEVLLSDQEFSYNTYIETELSKLGELNTTQSNNNTNASCKVVRSLFT